MKNLLIMAGLVLVVGCNRESAETAADGKAPGAGAAAGPAIRLDPGEWELTTSIKALGVPGMPAGMANSMPQGRKTKICITPEDADGPDGDIFSGPQPAGCRQEGYSWSGGTISGATICPGPAGAGEMRMAMSGTYAPQSFDATVKMNVAAGSTGGMNMETNVSGRRIGACPAGKTGA